MRADTGTGESKEGGCNAAARRLLVECSCVIPANRSVGCVVSQCFVGKEGEDLVLPDGPAETTANLVEPAFIALSKPRLSDSPRNSGVGSVVTLIRIQARAVYFDEGTPMEIIGSSLGCHLDLRPTETAALRIVTVRDYLDVADRIFSRSDDGSALPTPRWLC